MEKTKVGMKNSHQKKEKQNKKKRELSYVPLYEIISFKQDEF